MGLQDRYAAFLRLADQVFGSRCIVCSGQGIGNGLDICPSCYRHLPWNRLPCRRCASPVATSGETCARCREPAESITTVRAPWLFEPPIDHLIRQLKFHGSLANGRLLGGLLARTLQRGGAQADIVVPTPLHQRRLRERGFNQALELARPVAHQLAIPLCTGIVKRSRYTSMQSRLSGHERARNIPGAFVCNADLRGKRVAVVDDVATTLATSEAIADCLVKAGCASVELWVVARTSSPD